MPKLVGPTTPVPGPPYAGRRSKEKAAEEAAVGGKLRDKPEKALVGRQADELDNVGMRQLAQQILLALQIFLIGLVDADELLDGHIAAKQIALVYGSKLPAANLRRA